MVEYTVILMALTVALYTVTSVDTKGAAIGTDKNEEGSLMQAMHQRYQEQNFALRLTEMPEYGNLAEMKSYYVALNKHPKLAGEMKNVANRLNKITGDLKGYNQKISKLKDYKNIAKSGADKLKKQIKSSYKKVVKEIPGIN